MCVCAHVCVCPMCAVELRHAGNMIALRAGVYQVLRGHKGGIVRAVEEQRGPLSWGRGERLRGAQARQCLPCLRTKFRRGGGRECGGHTAVKGAPSRSSPRQGPPDTLPWLAYPPPFLPRGSLCSHSHVFPSECLPQGRGGEEPTGARAGRCQKQQGLGEGAEEARPSRCRPSGPPQPPREPGCWVTSGACRVPWQRALGIRVERALGEAHVVWDISAFPPGGVPCAVRPSEALGAPITSDLFSQKCGWTCSVPSALSHWPPRPAICLQAVRQLAGEGDAM